MDRKEIKPIEPDSPAAETGAKDAAQKTPKKETPNTSNHAFKSDDERSEFVKQLIASKQYFVNIRQKKYKRSALASKKPHKKKAVKPKESNDPNAASRSKIDSSTQTTGDLEKDAQRQKIMLIAATVIFAATYLLIDAGVLDVGFDVPIDIIPNSEPEIPLLDAEDALEPEAI